MATAPTPPALAAVMVEQLPIGNIGDLPRVPPTYALIDWRARAVRYVDFILSTESAAIGTAEGYTATSPRAVGQRVIDTTTYVGTPPKREAFPPLQTLLTGAALDPPLNAAKGCAPALGVDDCLVS